MSKTGDAKAKKPRAPPAHPTYNEMITKAIVALKERGGSSRQKIIKYIGSNFKVGDGFETHVKLALKRGVAKGSLLQTKGTGASGSFKVAKPEKPAPKPVVKKPVAKKPVVKKAEKPKKPAAKKATTAKPAKKTTPKKATTAKPKKTSVKKATTGKKTPTKTATKTASKAKATKPKPKKATGAKKTAKSPKK